MEASNKNKKGGDIMATRVPYNSRLSLVFQTGTDPNTGAPILKTKSYSNVKSAATDDDVFDVANAIAGLQKYVLYEIQRTDKAKLIT